MNRTGFTLATLLWIGAAVAACDSILGIDPFPDLPIDAGSIEGAGDAAPDATIDGARDATSDASFDAAVDQSQPVIDSGDGGGDAPNAPDGPPITECTVECDLGQATCIGPNVVESCVVNDAGCGRWDNGTTCGSGATCWGAPKEAYCCSGTTDYCAPSCHLVAAGTPDGGNGQTNCGPLGNEGCCTTLEVEGGTYHRSYDGITYTDDTNPATVSTFALDKYEVTVGRFRPFVKDVVDNFWRPESGAGVHTHLNGGQGLVDSSGDGGTYEQGWVSSYGNLFGLTQGDWDTALQCAGDETWTTSPGATEAYPVNCLTWEEAYAFCIWDGGFLPSEAEWNYAAAGGSEQRAYAWSNPPTSQLIDCTYANYDGPCVGNVGPVGADPKGNGRWGQSDLTGNVFEWTLDYFSSYVSPCVDCAYLTSTLDNTRTIRGMDFTYPASQEYVSTRTSDPDSIRYKDDGFRCARAPQP